MDKNLKEKKKEKKIAVYVFDTHQTWYKLVDPKQGYNHEKFERPPLNTVH